MISSLFSSVEVCLLTTKVGHEPVAKAFPTKTDDNVEFEFYTEPKDVEGSEFHESIRKSSKILLTLGLILALALAGGFYLAPTLLFVIPSWQLGLLVGGAIFLVITGVGVLIGSFMGTKGKEVCKLTYRDVELVCNPPKGKENQYNSNTTTPDDVFYIPRDQYKNFEAQLNQTKLAQATKV